MALTTKLTLNLVGNLAEKARANAQSLQQLGTVSGRAMEGMRRSIRAAGDALDRLGNRYTAVLTGATSAAALQTVIGLEERFTRLAIAANKPVGELQDLKRQIFDVSQMPDIRLDPSQLTSAIEIIVEKTGDLDYARKNIENIARVIQGAGADGKDIGQLFADIGEKFGLKDAAGSLRAIDLLVTQGKEAAFTLKDLAAQGPKVTAAYSVMGRSGEAAAREMGALLQMAIKATGSGDEAATSFNALMRDLVANTDKLAKYKISLWDPEELAKGKKVSRAVPDVVKEIIEKTKGDPELIAKILGDESRKAIAAIQGEWQKTGKFEGLDKLLGMQADGSSILKDSALAAGTATAALTNLKTAWTAFADSNLTAPIQKAADLLNSLGAARTEKLFQGLAIGAGVLGGLVLLKKTLTGIGAARAGLRGLFGGGAGTAQAIGKPMPVFVTNWQGGGGGAEVLEGGGKPGRGKGRRRPKARSRLARMGIRGRMMLQAVAARARKIPGLSRIGRGMAGGGRVASRLLPGVGAAFMGAQALSTLTDTSLSWKEKALQGGQQLGGIGGGLAGAKLGALLGTFVAPGVGTLAGGAIGGVAGALAGSEVIAALERWASDPPQQKAVVRLELPDGLRVQQMNGDENLELDVSSGMVFAP